MLSDTKKSRSDGPVWFDAHLDLAYLAETGRDMHTQPADARGRHQPVAVTLPSLAEGNIRACLGTIFTEAIQDPQAPDAEQGAFAYAAGDAQGAHMAGTRQLKLYQAWCEAGVIELISRKSESPNPSCLRASVPSCLLLGILMECADPIADPDELSWWADQGVIAIGMAWWHASRYAGGNGTESGLTDLGRELIRNMDRLGIVHDASHLSERSLDQLFDATDKTIIATHSNCRELIDGKNQRHLADNSIKEIARRGGVIGLNLFSPFLHQSEAKSERASIDDCCAHIERVCEIVGDRGHIGLGSDMDGGFGADRLPEGINHPHDLVRLSDALSTHGWSDKEITHFTWGAWAGFWGI